MLASTLIVSLIAAMPLAADEPSPEALFGRFRDNAQSFTTLKVQWRRDSARSDDGAAAEVARIDAIERRLATMDDSTDEYHRLNQEANARRQGLAGNYGPKRMFQTYLADRSHFMMRAAPPNWDVLQRSDDWLMPDVPVTEETMRTKYVGFTILAHGNPATPGFRTCMPTSGGTVGAYVRVQMFFDERSYFPPLAMDQAKFGPDTLRHPIDAFFLAGPKGFATVGRASIAGRDAVVIEGRVDIPSRDGQPARVERVRAYLDTDRGAMPLRIEWYDETPDPKKPIAKSGSAKPDRVLETTEIVSVGSGFYPAKGSVRVYGPDPNRPVEADSSIVLETMTWHAAKVEANVPLDETFALSIPKGTYYYDEARGATIQSGQETVNHARLPWTLCIGLVACWAAYAAIALVRATLARRRSGTDAKPPEMGEVA